MVNTRKYTIAVLAGVFLCFLPAVPVHAEPAITATFDLNETDPFQLEVDSDSLFDIEDAEFNTPYNSSLSFHNTTDKELTLSLYDVQSLLDSTVLYDKSHLKISDGDDVLYEGAMNDARFSESIPAGQSVTYTFTYSIVVPHVPDNSLMGTRMKARFWFVSGVDIPDSPEIKPSEPGKQGTSQNQVESSVKGVNPVIESVYTGDAGVMKYVLMLGTSVCVIAGLAKYKKDHMD